MVVHICHAEPSPQSQYIRNQNSPRVIVFVHGFRGDSVDTWSNGSMYWPEMITRDHDFDGVDVFVYQYPTSFFTAGMTPDELSADMEAVLKANKVSDRKQLVFIAHSMGGIVTRNFLFLNSDAANRTALIQFLATPTEGASLANLAAISNNPQIVKLTTNIEGDFLGYLSRHWAASENLRNIPSYCAYETQDFLHVRIVRYESATYLCNRNFDPVDANHFDIAKPKNFNSAPYATFKKNYMQVFQQTPTQSGQNDNALIVVGPGGSIGSFEFEDNLVSTSLPTDILHTQGPIGHAVVKNNLITTAPVSPKCRPGLSAQIEDPQPPSNESFLYKNMTGAPFNISLGRQVRNDDGTVDAYSSFRMYDGAQCEYITIAAASERGVIDLTVINAYHQSVGIDQIPIAGYKIKKLENPTGNFTLIVHASAYSHIDIKTTWR